VKTLLESSKWNSASMVFRIGAGVLIILLGVYFIVTPFTASF